MGQEGIAGLPLGDQDRSSSHPLTLIQTLVTSSYTTCGWTFLGTALAKARRCSSLSGAGMNRAGGRSTSCSRCCGRSRNMAQALGTRGETVTLSEGSRNHLLLD